MATYRIQPGGQVTLVMSAAECKALATLACDGADRIFNDADVFKATIGSVTQQQAARRAMDALMLADSAIRELDFSRKDFDVRR